MTTLKEFNNDRGETLRGVLIDASDTNDAVLMMGGFERAGTTEKKYKILSDKLAENNIASFRFDSTDCGLSDGNFYNMTMKNLAADLLCAYNLLIDCGYKKISIVVHSLGGCALALLLNKISFKKIVLIAPALNQKELLRLWFAQQSNENLKIDWNNYRDYFDENKFIENLQYDLTTKSHKLNSSCRADNQDKDFSQNYMDFKGFVLLIHGATDKVVPVESLNIDFPRKIIIEKGDHDLERPGIIEQWLGKAVEFLKN